jgi:hypothetical protein
VERTSGDRVEEALRNAWRRRGEEVEEWRRSGRVEKKWKSGEEVEE